MREAFTLRVGCNIHAGAVEVIVEVQSQASKFSQERVDKSISGFPFKYHPLRQISEQRRRSSKMENPNGVTVERTLQEQSLQVNPATWKKTLT